MSKRDKKRIMKMAGVGRWTITCRRIEDYIKSNNCELKDIVSVIAAPAFEHT